MTARIPPVQCLLTFEALARLRSVTQAAEELCVTPSAVSHRVKQLEQAIGAKLFGRADFSLTTEGSEYLAHVREGLASLEKFPGRDSAQGKRKLRVAVTPTFSRSVLMPRLRGFIEAYPEIDLTLQVSIPLLDVVAEDAFRFTRAVPGADARSFARAHCSHERRRTGGGHRQGAGRQRRRRNGCHCHPGPGGNPGHPGHLHQAGSQGGRIAG